jgi:threonine dehydrogenase-like Zn-dependent dehydrogenase
LKKKLCVGLGAEKWVDFRESQDLVKDVQAATDGLGPEAALIVAGEVKCFNHIYFFLKYLLEIQITPFNQAIMYLRRKGTLVCVGMPAGNALLNVPVALLIAKVNEIDIPPHFVLFGLTVLYYYYFQVHDYCGISDWVNFCAFPTFCVF